MTTISVIIPAYNARRTILSTIESVQQQTFKDLEIIVIDDGSSDRTSELLATVIDERLKVYSYPNGGLPIARNRGITHARGEYISFIDADDLWTKDKLEKQLAALQANPKAGVAYSWIVAMVEAKRVDTQRSSLEMSISEQNWLDFGESGVKLLQSGVESASGNFAFVSGEKVTFTGDIYSQLLLRNFVGNGSNILARREAIDLVGEFDPSLKSCEDWDYYLRLAAKFHFALVPEPQILYRKTAGTMTSKGAIMEREGLKVINSAYQTAPKHLQGQKNQSIAIFAIYCGRIYADRGSTSEELTEARQRLWKSIKLYPQILFSQDTSILFIKILLKQLLPERIINNLISTIKKPFKIEKLR